MTIRDLLLLNIACLDDHITIKNDDETILELIPISEIHPIWLDYEVQFYYLLPHKDGERISVISCDYLITIEGRIIIQDRTTKLDKALNERIIERNKNNVLDHQHNHGRDIGTRRNNR